jgi:NAD(P)-dependent dehydrogenase (short-subunit alcohol dehydrogenase family)
MRPGANGRPSNFPAVSRHDSSNVADQGSVDAAAAWVAQRYGRCDALVNNAGVDYDTDAMAASADLARVHRAMETNLFGAWRTCLALLPLLRESPFDRTAEWAR